MAEAQQGQKTVAEETLKSVYGVEESTKEKVTTVQTGENVEYSEEWIRQATPEELRTALSTVIRENAQLRKEIAEYKELAVRRAAELENFRRRVEREKEQIVRYANEKLLLELLPFIDDLHRAVESGKQQKNYEALIEGIELIYSKIMGILERLGVKPIETVGKPFDVELHEALMHIPHEAPEGEIVQEIQRGYMYGDKVLRHAKVITSAGKQADGQSSQQQAE